MGNCTGHYFGRPAKGHSPACWVSVVVQPSIAAELPEGAAAIPMGFGRVHVVASRRDHGRWCKPQVRSFDTPEGFWRWLELWAWNGRKCYIVSPTASDALTYLRFWDRVELLGGRYKQHVIGPGERVGAGQLQAAFKFDRLVLRGVPDIIEYTFQGKNYLWMSGHQFFQMTEDELSDAVLFPRDRDPESGAQIVRSTWTDPERAELWHHAMRQLGDWWEGLKAGGWGRTIGAMALNFLRSRVPRPAVATHKCEESIRLERLACHGGRATAWFFGRVGTPEAQGGGAPAALPSTPWDIPSGTLYHVDVKSMYPWLMTQVDLPTSRVMLMGEMSTSSLRSHLRGFCVVALVTVRTEVAEYPHRRGASVLYPVGEYTSVLCGPELERCLAENSVKTVHQAVLYTRGKPFAPAAAELLAMRGEAENTRNSGWSAFVKLLSNSLTGKLAQRKTRWRPLPRYHAEQDWGEWIHWDERTDTMTRRRAIAGMVEEQLREAGGVGTLTACYAHITAAGRCLMRSLREACPPRSVVSQDTDGLWLTEAGVRALKVVPNGHATSPGQLREVGTSDHSRFWGPKHYFAGDRWVLAGLHEHRPTSDGLSFDDTWVDNPVRRGCDAPPQWVIYHGRRVTLSAVPSGGLVGQDGWLQPVRLPLAPGAASVFTDPRTDATFTLGDAGAA